MNIYIERLENIIRDMQSVLPKQNYLPWLYFLREIYPESELLKADDESSHAREPTVEEDSMKQKECRDIRELMILAEQNGYPLWRIYPCMKEPSSEVVDPILFPTERIQTISSQKLHELFKKYLSTLKEEEIVADMILIKSDNRITAADGESYESLIFHLSHN